MLPRVIMHNTMSLDGRIDWFSADVGLYYEIASRWKVNAMLSGADTIIAGSEQMAAHQDDPDPPSESGKYRRPLLVVTDSQGRVADWGPWLKAPYWSRIIVLCSSATPKSYISKLEKAGLGHIIAGKDRVDLKASLERLCKDHGVKTVRLDCGGRLNGAMFRAGLVDEVSILIHPALVGGTSPRSVFNAPDLKDEDGVVKLDIKHMERVRGGYVWLRYKVVR
jgi:2,5-diamino-6-(ribosylamino)-4(3H)-pyrimidinone 5'-phosphate reductase